MSTRVDQGGDSVTEVLNGGYKQEKKTYPFKNVSSRNLAKKYSKNFKNTNGYVLTSSEDESARSRQNGMSNANLSSDQNKYQKSSPKESFEPPTIITLWLAQVSFALLMLLGFLSQLFFPPKCSKEKNRKGYPPLFDKFALFYSRYVYRRIRDCWNYPICSVPAKEVVLKERYTPDNGWTFHFTGNEIKCLNLASYNYLGFAEAQGPCAEFAIESIYKYGVSTGSTRQKYGTCDLHNDLEKLLSEFLCTEDAITFGMGYATNALNLPTLLGAGCLVISDERNHASIIVGIRCPDVTIKIFKHNNVQHLEEILQESIINGQPNCPKGEYKPWRKIFIVVEGVYSMEGSVVRLPEIIALKKKYKAYLYLDEAHSIGAMGKNGRGVIDYYDCDPKDVDIQMGTFTKSFGSAGGYIAGSKDLIGFLRENSYASKHAWAMPPPVAAQIIAVLKILMGKDGTDEGRKRIETLSRNTRYFRMRLQQIGVIVHGSEDSPVVPILVYFYSKIVTMVRSLIKYNIATVGVGYPATPLYQGRIRICLSAAHTKEQLDYALDVIEKVADEMGLKYSRKNPNLQAIDYDKIKL